MVAPACHPNENLFLDLMNDAISDMSGVIPAVPTSRVALGSRISVPLYPGVEHVNTEQTRPWTSSSQESSARNLRIEDTPTSSGGTWRVVMIFGSLLLATPILFVTAPAMITLSQILLGCGLATATWMIVKYPTDKAQVGQTIKRLTMAVLDPLNPLACAGAPVKRPRSARNAPRLGNPPPGARCQSREAASVD